MYCTSGNIAEGKGIMCGYIEVPQLVAKRSGQALADHTSLCPASDSRERTAVHDFLFN